MNVRVEVCRNERHFCVCVFFFLLYETTYRSRTLDETRRFYSITSPSKLMHGYDRAKNESPVRATHSRRINCRGTFSTTWRVFRVNTFTVLHARGVAGEEYLKISRASHREPRYAFHCRCNYSLIYSSSYKFWRWFSYICYSCIHYNFLYYIVHVLGVVNYKFLICFFPLRE